MRPVTLAALGLAACPRPAPPVVTPPAPKTLVFAPADPTGVDLASVVTPVVSARAAVDGVDVPVAYHVIAQTGPAFGGVLRQDGSPVAGPLCEEQDFNSLLPLGGGRAALLSHFECIPGGMTITRLDPDPAHPGDWVIAAPPERIDWTAWGGLWAPCSGMVSPWGTHLGSEEYEPDVRSLADNTDWTAMVGWYTDPATANPYRYGWATEVALGADGAPVPRKHYALGRLSHELSYVLPDRRTVIQSDDGTGVGLYLFVADAAEDLTAGALYAAKFAPTDAADTASITWVPLGHATHGEIAALVDRGVGFDDLFEAAVPEDDRCPDWIDGRPRPGGMQLVVAAGERECLKLRDPSPAVPNPALAASRLETRRYAAYLGATHELEKAEGLAFDPASQRVFLSLSALRRRTSAEPDEPVDGLRLREDPCGAVVALDTAPAQVDTAGAPIPSDLVPTRLAIELAGTPLPEGKACAEDGIANPDNLTFLAGYGILAIAEDTNRHANARLWAYDVRSRSLVPVVYAPPDGEITGIHWIPDLHGHGYLTLAVQHPWARRAEADPGAAATDPDQRSFTGYLGPFPPLGPTPADQGQK